MERFTGIEGLFKEHLGRVQRTLIRVRITLDLVQTTLAGVQIGSFGSMVTNEETSGLAGGIGGDGDECSWQRTGAGTA
jgi:hypothetical protein